MAIWELDFDKWNSNFAGTVYGERTSQAIHQGLYDPERRDLNQILNTRPDPIDQRDFRYSPSLVDLPPRYFNQRCTQRKFRVKTQGVEGSCVGQALAALVDLQNLDRHERKANVPTRVSSRFLYKNAQQYDHHPDDSLQGSSLRGAIKGFYHNGVCDEKLAKYLAIDSNFLISNKMWDDARRVSLGTYFRLEHILNHYHCALKECKSILCSAIIHTGWDKNAVAFTDDEHLPGRIKYPMVPSKTDGNFEQKPASLSGGHAFVIVGFDETGFLVLNSWGNSWGRFPVEGLKDNCFKHPLDDTTLRGVAHWKYEDWADNVLDAWVLRLAVPTGLGTDFVGGRPKRVGQKDPKGAARKRDVQGYFMHMQDRKLVQEPPYDNSIGQFVELANDLRDKEEHRHYRHIVFFAHGGLSTLDSASARAAAMIPTFKKNGIYPMFFLWRTGFGHMLGNVIEGILSDVEERSRDYSEMKDAAIERLSKPIGRAIWNDIKRNAEACFNPAFRENCLADSGEQPGEPAWDATKALINICTEQFARPNDPLKLHFVGHSAGVFLLGELFARLGKKQLKELPIETINLLAPCCQTGFLETQILERVICENKNTTLSVFNLSPDRERAIDPVMSPYSKSFPSLVSNSFYDLKPAHIAALDQFWQADIRPFINSRNLGKRVDYILSGQQYVNEMFKCTAKFHGNFDNDACTMNTILQKILACNESYPANGQIERFTDEQLNRGDF